MIDNKIWVGNKIIGEVKGKFFCKKVSGKKHFLQKPPAIANDISILHDAMGKGATIVAIFDTDTKLEYFSYIDVILRKGFVIDRGYGKQMALPMNMWVSSLYKLRIPEKEQIQERLF
jgi:hypothetical protein